MSQDSQLEITEQQVKDYLQQHPDFFQHHLDILEKMHIPHPSGNAISLISKQLEVFRTKHQEQENQLAALIDIARDNDAAFNRMHELTLSMLEARCLEDVVANLAEVLHDCFLTDFVAIKIIQECADSPISNLFVSPDDAALKYFADELKTNKAHCGRPTFPQACFLFGDAAPEVKSAAIIPMVFTQMEGLLAIGSRDESRFHFSMGSMFLTQMSEVVGTRLIALMQQMK
jgi:uncharacterized protein YigA (DUF484 family)